MKVTLSQNTREVQSEALLDSGAYSCFIHYRFAQEHNLVLRKLKNEVRVFNADATENRKGRITHYTRCLMRIGNHLSWQSFLVTDIGRQDLIVGISFLREHNPEIDWSAGQIEFKRCSASCAHKRPPVQEEELRSLQLPRMEEVAKDQLGDLGPEDWGDRNQFIHWVNFSEDPDARQVKERLNDKAEDKKELDREYWSQHVPKQYHQYGDVFSKVASDRMPKRKPYDHAIELVPGATLPKPAKLYPLSPEECSSLDA